MSSAPQLAAELWNAYAQQRTIERRNMLAEHYQPLVSLLSEKFHAKLPACVELDDVWTFANIGLLDAIEKFEPDRGVKFNTYAPRRIAGAIKDGLREDDWVPRLERRRNKSPVEMQSLSAPLWETTSGRVSTVENVQADQSATDSLEKVDARDWFERVCCWLTTPEKLIVKLYYIENETMKNIGRALGISESRVCQIHANVLSRLKSTIPHDPAVRPVLN